MDNNFILTAKDYRKVVF